MEIVLENAGRRFNRQWIFRHISLSIASGERLAIIGSNGSGKSTFLSCLATYLLLSEGSIFYNIREGQLDSGKLQKHFSWMAPAVDLPEELKLIEVLKLHFALKGCIASEEEVLQWLEFSGLIAHREKLIKQLSSGMRQRVKMIATFLSDSSLLLLDEPTTDLDSDGKLLYRQLVNETGKERTIIIASNLPEEYEFCERAIPMDKKKTG